jgi:hypothetical protein
MTMALSLPVYKFDCSMVDREEEQGTAADVDAMAQVS